MMCNAIARHFDSRVFKAARVACLPEQQHGLSLVGVRVLRTLRVSEPKPVMLVIGWCTLLGSGKSFQSLCILVCLSLFSQILTALYKEMTKR